MWFDPSMTEAYSLGIEPAIEQDCGLRAIRIDRVEHNNQITDEIMAGIRGAQFMVADFTKHRNGVYYEAGFARGLGRDVIYCCREDSFKERHFDTSVINHIVWSDPADLRRKLVNRIQATILPKA
jgi:nucleoside 2-deoxyribosyltransferase